MKKKVVHFGFLFLVSILVMSFVQPDVDTDKTILRSGQIYHPFDVMGYTIVNASGEFVRMKERGTKTSPLNAKDLQQIARIMMNVEAKLGQRLFFLEINVEKDQKIESHRLVFAFGSSPMEERDTKRYSIIDLKTKKQYYISNEQDMKVLHDMMEEYKKQ